MDFLRQLFSSGDFMPHGYCYLWNSGLVWLHVISDGLIALAYFTIPFTLLWLVRKRRDLPFSWIFVLFGIFIVACGATHVMEIWNLWHAEYWLAGVVKAVTAVASVGTAILLARLAPRAAELPSVAKWIRANAALENEIHERRELEIDLRISEERYREQAELLDLTHDAIFVRNLKSEILYWNRAAERIYGWSAEEARGKISHELLQTVFPKDLAEIQTETLATGTWEGQLRHTSRNGSAVTVYSRWAVRYDTDGNPESVLESNRDVTKNKLDEQKFRNLLEAAPDAIVIVNQGGQIQLVNAQTEKLFGYSRDELVGMAVEILVPQRFQLRHAGHREAYAHAPQPRSIGSGLELYGRRKDGSEFPLEISLGPLQTAEGTLTSASIRDVSERKPLAEQFREHELRFRLLIDAVKDYAIISLDPGGMVTTWNAGAQRLKGYAAEEIIGRHLSVLYPPEALADGRLDDELLEAEASGHVEAQGWRVRKDGSRFWAEVVTTALRDSGGKLLGFAKIDKDITARRETEEQIQKLNLELNQRVFELGTANKELESFSYSVSHDLRAPLRHVDGFARILKEEFAESIPEDGVKYLDRILDAATHMGHLVDDLLNLARIGRQELKREKTDMGRLVKQAIAGIPPDVEERNIEWRIEALPELNCDPGLITVVLTNLLSNAAKFTRKQPVAIIEIGSGFINSLPTIFVRDNGVGFDPRYADKLFGVFQRLRRQEDFEGTGVGLATVQRIVRRHGGEIWAQSKAGCGAEFSFTLGPQSRLLVENLNVGVNHA
ncbi:MAG: PAS domain S-box protein [Candidatus Acidiferrales bacterium]